MEFIQCEKCAVAQWRLKNTVLVHNLKFHNVFVHSHLAGWQNKEKAVRPVLNTLTKAGSCCLCCVSCVDVSLKSERFFSAETQYYILCGVFFLRFTVRLQHPQTFSSSDGGLATTRKTREVLHLISCFFKCHSNDEAITPLITSAHIRGPLQEKYRYGLKCLPP